ncbi:hypothetical protein D3C84_1163670 [compost metagenome]
MHRAVGEQAQATVYVAAMGSDLLLRHHPPAMLAGVRLEGFARQRLRVAVDVIEHIVGLGRAVVVTGAVFARQAVDLG